MAILALPVWLAACGGGSDKAECLADSCSGHGSCDDSSGAIVCNCDAGYAGASCGMCAPEYQDRDGDGSCLPTCAIAELDCSGHGVCDAASGVPLCDCEGGYAGETCADCAEGYQDADDDGACLPTCDTLGWDCGGHGSCDHSSGEALCICDAGYQDHDGDGSCNADCATAGLDCGDHGACDDSAGEAQCDCDQGWGGAACGRCADDWQDNDGDGVCEPGCGAGVIDCGDYGFCNDDSGHARCTCITGHAGADCSQCADGYQDHDGDGACLPGCDLFGGNCGAHGHCDDSSGTAECVCDTGHSGDNCAICAEGYQDHDGDGACWPTCATAGLDCGDHGACDDSGGLAVCACDAGYAGELCSLCAGGYQDHDGDGLCALDCAHAGLGCSGHSHCDDSGGAALCVCDDGYTGADCDTCAGGYQDHDGNGTCRPTCETLAWDCSGHGSCDDSDGSAACVCDAAYTGDQCQQCAAGYQDHDGDGSCRADCASAAPDCGANAHCDDGSGQAVCVCDTGYTGIDCTQCAAGYQDVDGDGTCLPSCENLGWTCSGHGVCSYAAGAATCDCDDGYVHDGSGNCLEAGAGEDCSSPLLLDLAAGQVEGNTEGMGNDAVGSCDYTDSAADVVYVFSAPQAVHVIFETEGFDTVMYLRSDCDDPASEIDCDDQGGPGNGSRLDVDLEPGTYYLYVDGYSDYSGQYSLTIDVACGAGYVYYPVTGECIDDPCEPNPCDAENQHTCQPVLPGDYNCACDPGYIEDPDNPGSCIPDPNPHGEACADAMPLLPGEGTAVGSTADAADDGSGTCAGNGPDRVYGFTLAEAMRVEFDMTGYDTVLHLRSACADQGSEVACDDDGGSGTNAQLVATLDPGTYYLWADSYSGGGDYDLAYSFRADPCAGDPCPGTPECVAAPDWSSFECVCPQGTLPFDGDCVDDPCDPNQCSEAHKNRCVPDLPGAYHCECNIGYIPDPDNPDACIMDPDANEWAFIVFLNADNNLNSYGYDDVAEMGEAGSTPYVHIAALFDTYDGPAQVIYVTEGGYDVVEDWGEQDMSDWQTLRDFGIWAVQNYPARHYAFIMWDHGDGWKQEPTSPVTKGFSSDDHGGSGEISISNGDYAAAMAGITAELGAKVDIVGFDACLMGMWEVAKASAPYAHYLLASEETEPGIGWPYHGFLPGLVNDWEQTPLELASSIVDAYYNETTQDDTLSVIDLDTMPALDIAMTALADALIANPGCFDTIGSIRGSTQSFYISDHRDLKDFAERVAAEASLPQSVQDAAAALVDQLEVSIAYSRAQSSHPGAKGMAIYFPSYGVDAAYTDAGAVWSQDTTWDEFLEDFTQ